MSPPRASVAAPSFLDLAEEVPAALGSEDSGGHSKASVSFPIKALSVHQGLDCANGQEPRLLHSSFWLHLVGPWMFPPKRLPHMLLSGVLDHLHFASHPGGRGRAHQVYCVKFPPSLCSLVPVVLILAFRTSHSLSWQLLCS